MWILANFLLTWFHFCSLKNCMLILLNLKLVKCSTIRNHLFCSLKYLQSFSSESVSDVDNLRLTSEKANDPNSASQVPSKSSSTKTKSVSWDDKVIEGKFADSDDSDDASPTPALIKFHHTSSVNASFNFVITWELRTNNFRIIKTWSGLFHLRKLYNIVF